MGMYAEPFCGYVERQPRCEAVELRYENVWPVAQMLIQLGYEVNVRQAKEGLFLEAKRDDTSFTANVDNGDALIVNGYADLEHIAGAEFRRAWQKEDK